MQNLRPAQMLGQKQTLAPQMIQQINLLAMPVLELRERILEELENNPALTGRSDSFDMPFSQVAKEFRNKLREDENSKRKFLEGAVSSDDESLQEYLLFQLRVQKLDEKTAAAAELLIQNLDENGFHWENPFLVSGADEATTRKAMDIVRMLDPQGTCTSDYRESLLVQAQLSGNAPEKTEEAIENHLADLERGHFTKTASALGISEKKAEEIYSFIKTLNPFPGKEKYRKENNFVIPDLRITREENSIRIYLNNDNIPSLSIDSYFREQAENSSDPEVSKFAGEKIREAKSFIGMVKMRNDTLLRTANVIARLQKPFFMEGPRHLVPLTQKKIAEEIEMDESTISRLVSEKYVQTDWGVFRLKHFFSSAVQTEKADGTEGELAKESVKLIIKEIIEENRTGKKLSDQKISDILRERGITLARRTVAKYRKELDIASSFER